MTKGIDCSTFIRVLRLPVARRYLPFVMKPHPAAGPDVYGDPLWISSAALSVRWPWEKRV